MTQKNILILHTDQQRYDSLGSNGNPFARTPNLDALAADATCFTRHIAASPICMPSRASLMTGLYPPGHNVYTNGVALNRQEYTIANPAPQWLETEIPPVPPTLADVFARAGYDTVAFGKLHLTPHLAPTSCGYPETYALWHSGELSEWRGPYYGFRQVELTLGHGGQVFETGHYALWLQREHPEAHQQLAAHSKQAARPVAGLADLYSLPAPEALLPSAWLAERFAAYLEARPLRPFFAFIGFPDPHHPFTPSQQALAEFEGMPVQEPRDADGQGLPAAPLRDRFGTDISHLSPEDKRQIIRYTYAMVAQIDRAVGRILEALKAHHLYEDTIILFTSDHGDFLGDHGRLRKGEVGSHALLHVPCILRAPGAQLPPQVSAPMSNADILPTLAALAGVEAPAWVHGKDMGRVIRQGEVHHVFAFCADGNPAHVNYTVYDPHYRMTYYPYNEYVELFDHREDPAETNNLAMSQPRTVLRLMSVLQERMLHYHNPILSRVSAW